MKPSRIFEEIFRKTWKHSTKIWRKCGISKKIINKFRGKSKQILMKFWSIFEEIFKKIWKHSTKNWRKFEEFLKRFLINFEENLNKLRLNIQEYLKIFLGKFENIL